MTITDVLKLLGQDAATRACMVAALNAYERQVDHGDLNVRDEVTGPLVDALHASVGTLRKTLSNGLIIEFAYRSKIARDFVMSIPDEPDHVWEPQTTKLLLHLCGAANEVVVGGAYFGDQAIPIADALRGRGICHAFEADPDQATMLRRNAELNGLDNLRVNSIGLWSDDDTHLRFVGDDALSSPVASADGVAVTTLDVYAQSSGVGRIDLIMLDVEGGELNILRGGECTLRRDRPNIVFEIHSSYVDWSNGLGQTEIVRFLTSLGYILFAVRDFQSNIDLRGQPIELVPIETAYLDGPPHGFNLVAVSDPLTLAGESFRVVPNVSPKLLRHRAPPLHQPSGGFSWRR